MGKHGGGHFGGHSHGGHIGHHHTFGHHHHSKGGGGGGPGGVGNFEMIAEMQSSIQLFNVNNGILISSGSQMIFNTRLEQLNSEQTQSINQLNLTIVGQKVQATNTCCLFSTFLAGSFLIFPFILMCFQWWKDIVHPKYILNIKTYQQIVNLVRKCPQVTFLNLVVIDNNLTKQKIETLSQGLFQGSSIIRFSLINNALQSNYQNKQYDHFEQNVQSFKRLNLKSCQMQWSDKLIYLGLDNQSDLNQNGFTQLQLQNIGTNNQHQIQNFRT